MMNMMVQSTNPPPYSFQSKTAEIMSRYRPIAPKPLNNNNHNNAAPEESTTLMKCQETQQHLRTTTLWPTLHDRPTTKTRKRSRGGGGALLSLSLAPPTFKRTAAARTTHHLLPLSFHHHHPPRLNPNGGFEMPPPRVTPTRTTADQAHPTHELRFLKSSSSSTTTTTTEEKLIDLNAAVDEKIPLEEKDLLRQLQDGPHTGGGGGGSTVINVIAPQPVRPIGSSISVIGCVSKKDYDDPSSSSGSAILLSEEAVEEEVETETLPAVISDSNNKVRLANSAYKEMVGQPECSWLGLGGGSTASGGGGKRIGGEVMLRVAAEDSKVVAQMSNGFCCWVRIEWGGGGSDDGYNNNKSIGAFCEAKRLTCQSNNKDYVFVWRFHTDAKHQPSYSTTT